VMMELFMGDQWNQQSHSPGSWARYLSRKFWSSTMVWCNVRPPPHPKCWVFLGVYLRKWASIFTLHLKNGD